MKQDRGLGRAKDCALLARVLSEVPGRKRILYVGANVRRFQLYDALRGHELCVLEVWPPYVRELLSSAETPVAGVIQGDIRDIDENDQVNALAPFDLVLWWHGCEHVSQVSAEELLRPGGVLEAYWRDGILLGMPWGVYHQARVRGNPHEEHCWSVYPDWLTGLGYETGTVGQPDRASGKITAWKGQARDESGKAA